MRRRLLTLACCVCVFQSHAPPRFPLKNNVNADGEQGPLCTLTLGNSRPGLGPLCAATRALRPAFLGSPPRRTVASPALPSVFTRGALADQVTGHVKASWTSPCTGTEALAQPSGSSDCEEEAATEMSQFEGLITKLSAEAKSPQEQSDGSSPLGRATRAAGAAPGAHPAHRCACPAGSPSPNQLLCAKATIFEK